jgi:ABC-2 type transport system ATP-binding protein
MTPVIEVSALTKRYGTARGIEEVTFAVEPGEVFGFLGPNGAGKTTTIRTLMGALHPTSGTARIFGIELREDTTPVRRRTGYLAGDVALYPHMTGRQLFTYFGALRGDVDRVTLDGLVERLDVDPDRKIEDLSHGNRQKVGLVQAFMHRPDLVILDEPTQGLDPLVQQTFHTIVDETRADGRTVFVSSHVLSEVERICDRVGIIREGRLVAVESVDALRHRAFRSFEVRFEDSPPREALRAIGGLTDLQVEGDLARFHLAGPPEELLRVLADRGVLDLVSEKPSLEDAFLAYYGGPAEQPAETPDA